MDLFRVRLNCIDHYQATPTRYDPQLRNDVRPSQVFKGAKVPVVRIFGSTETGQKVCAHVHGAFPYLYVEYQGSLEPEEVGAYIYRLHLSIDHALAVSYRRDQHGEQARFVARITLIKGIPFFGFQVGYQFYLKIYMFNPIVMTRLADLLHQGVIMKRKFQPFEAHLQYLLQFMTDYNLYGCDYLDASKTNFRAPIPNHDDGTSSSHLWHSLSVPSDQVTDDVSLPRVSHCSIEVDICVQNIVNRKKIRERLLHHDFTESKYPIPEDAKLVFSMAGLWKDETKRRKRQMSIAKQGTSPFPPEVLVSMSADPRSEPQGWIHEEEYREKIRNLVQEEAEMAGMPLDFETPPKPAPLEVNVKTALDSVEDLYPSNLMPVLGLPSNPSQVNQDPTSSIDVDEQRARLIHGHDDDFFPEDSDEEGLRELVTDSKTGSVKAKIKSSREHDDDNQADSWQSLSGICLSGLKTGKIPKMPVLKDLLNVADADGLVSRTQSQNTALSTPTKLKRSLSRTSSVDQYAKRIRRGTSSPSTAQEIDHRSQAISKHSSRGFEAPRTALTKLPSSEGRKSSSTSADANATNGTLNFTICKDQDDPNTRLRLSQKSRNASSQKTEEHTPGRHVSFDPATLEGALESRSSQTSLSPLIQSGHSDPQSQVAKLKRAVGLKSAGRTLIFAALPPIVSDLTSLAGQQLPDMLYQDAYYSKEKDVPPRMREYAGREFRLESNTLPFLPDFDPTGTYGNKSDLAQDKPASDRVYDRQRRDCSWRSWEFAQPPPAYDEVETWYNARGGKFGKQRNVTRPAKHPVTPLSKRYFSQIDGPTPANKHGFRYTQKSKNTSVQHEVQYMSTMSLEVHVNTRGKFVPNPEEDEIKCIFWSLQSDEAALSSQDPSKASQSGIVVLCTDGVLTRQIQRMTSAEVVAEETELDLMTRVVEIVRAFDPDILTGYEVHGGSWGYLIERARFKFDYNLCDEFSRMKVESHGRFGKDNDKWGFNTTSTIRVTGRHMINIWRAMRGELTLLQYTMENVAWHVLHRRIPHYAWKTLTSWFTSGKHHELSRLLKYYQIRTRLDIGILESNELIARTSEQARLLGVDFFSVFSRGSQFKVESIMFRIAKPENFILVSPNRKQVGGQNALECLPLVMEPQSAFYSSPLLVLDFQSLYPSVMIAYNYCYSTFLGRITNWRGMNKMGFTEYKRQQGMLALLKDYINIAPNGIMYVKTEIRKSLLAKMLKEILETRFMVKDGMKKEKDDKTLQRLLNNRQLALKLLANVTYGYTSASFSGRMPCSEIADSIVQTGRETLERAIAYIHTVERWGAEVVYGDTDSLFIYLKGRTRDQAFDIGNEIAKAITDMNPRPIKLKFEKVYHPCVLLAKKRYVGYKYEKKDQIQPDFDAKGIETVRRDGTPAEQRIEEKALKLLFETADLSQIKNYFQKQCDKIMRGSVSVQDFCFAREVRLGSYSDKGPPPAGALISTKRMLEDARAEPQYGERVPYVVITGAPGARLIDRSVAPEDLLSNPHWQLDAEYYISKNLIPPLERIFNLVGANVRQWYDEMPKVQRAHHGTALGGRKTTLESYMRSTHCLVCAARFTSDGGHSLCPACRANAPASLLRLQTRLTTEEKKFQEIVALCQSCSGLSPLEDVKCDSKDCPVFWTRMRQGGKLRGERMATEPVIRGLVEGAERMTLDW